VTSITGDRSEGSAPEPGAGFLARWAVVVETEASPSDIDPDGCPRQEAVHRWFAEARAAYLDRCLHLSEEVRRGRVRVRVDALRMVPTGGIEPSQTILVAVTVTELRDTSFDMALRVRSLGDRGSVVANGSCTLVLEGPKRGAALTLPDAVCRDLLTLESGASDYC
jgi:acyl-CoA thioesterase FadM